MLLPSFVAATKNYFIYEERVEQQKIHFHSPKFFCSLVVSAVVEVVLVVVEKTRFELDKAIKVSLN